MKNGTSVSSLPRVNIVQVNMYTSTLGMSQVTPVHSGMYSCSATNSVGFANTTLQLKVHGNENVTFSWLRSRSPAVLSFNSGRNDYIVADVVVGLTVGLGPHQYFTVYLTCFLLVGPKFVRPFLEDMYFQFGKFATIMCSLEDGDPPISFSWTKDGSLATSLPDIQVINQKFSSFLTISPTTSVHSGAYFCKASNPVSWAAMAVNIYINGTS